MYCTPQKNRSQHNFSKVMFCTPHTQRQAGHRNVPRLNRTNYSIIIITSVYYINIIVLKYHRSIDSAANIQHQISHFNMMMVF